MDYIMSINVGLYRFIWCLHWATVAEKPCIEMFLSFFAQTFFSSPLTLSFSMWLFWLSESDLSSQLLLLPPQA